MNNDHHFDGYSLALSQRFQISGNLELNFEGLCKVLKYKYNKFKASPIVANMSLDLSSYSETSQYDAINYFYDMAVICE